MIPAGSSEAFGAESAGAHADAPGSKLVNSAGLASSDSSSGACFVSEGFLLSTCGSSEVVASSASDAAESNDGSVRERKYGQSLVSLCEYSGAEL